MREIKFRAYDKIDKYIKQVHNINFHDRVVVLQDKVGNREQRTFDDIELMQYTNIEDKNGEIVCEGDIVKVSNELATVRLQYACFIVDFVNKFNEDYNEYGFDYDYLYNLTAFEIVGDIYQNPELLKGEEDDNTNTK